MSGKRRPKSAGAISLLEEVFHTAGSLPLTAWAGYYIPTFPLVLAFLYFWADMAYHAFAYDRLVIGAAVLTMLFIAAKTGQSLFAQHVKRYLVDGAIEQYPNVFRLALNQTILQPVGLIILPICFVILAPFGWVYAIFQNMTVLDDGHKGLGDIVREARKQAGYNVKQNHILLWLVCPYIIVLAAAFFLILLPILRATAPEWTDIFMGLYSIFIWVLLVPLCPFGIIVALNIGVALQVIPFLLKMLLGIETDFTVNSSGMINPTFYMIVIGLTYLCLDPLIKIAYTLRCFYGDSVHTGGDLRIKLRRLMKSTASLVLLSLSASLLLGHPVWAQEVDSSGASQVSSLDRAIDEALQDRKFAWRSPRERERMDGSGFMDGVARATRDFGNWLGDVIRDIIDWLRDLAPDRDTAASSSGGLSGSALRGMVVALLIVLLIVLLYVGWRTWRQQNIIEIEPVEAEPAVPDLEDESTSAEELPSNEWLVLARDLMAKGDVRLAMRAYFFAGLARLAQLRLIQLASHKSNREYARELRRIAHVNAELVGSFGSNLNTFESVWYGDHEIRSESLRNYVDVQERIADHA